MPKNHITIPFFIPHLGCRHRCVFCNQVYTSYTYNIPNEFLIRQKVDQYLQHIKPSVHHIEIAFFGGSFTGLDIESQKQFLSIANNYYRNNVIHGIRLSTRPDYINHDILHILKSYNVSTIELGVQSMDEKVLICSNRGHTTDDVINAYTLIKEYGFKCILQLMPGLPGDSYEKSIQTTYQVIRLNPDGVRIYPTVVIKDTQLEYMYMRGEYTPLTLEEAITICADMYEIFTKHSIQVIRIGLHPFDKALLHTIIAGPYHPAFGYHVKSRYYRNYLASLIQNTIRTDNHTSLSIEIPKQHAAEYLGPGRENIIYLERVYHCSLDVVISHRKKPAIRLGR